MKLSRDLSLACAGVALAIMGQFPAFAHGSMAPQHGGRVLESSETLVELVAGAEGVSIYVTDDDSAPLPAAGYSARLTINANGEKTEIPLADAGGNRFDAPALAIPAGAELVVALTSKADGSRVFVTFPSP